MIAADDRGLTLGDGLFETVLAEHGRLEAWEAHLRRMGEGCAVLGLPPPDASEALRLAQAALDAAGLAGARAAVRLTLTAGSGGRGLDRPQALAARLFATAAAAPSASGPLRLATVDVRRNAASPASRLKSLAYLDNVLARRQARAAGADEGLMLNTDGAVACAAAANLFWIRDGRLFTPALDCGVLAGVVRAQVIVAAAAAGIECLQVRVARDELSTAEAAFLTNSLIGLRSVSALDGRVLPHSPLLDRLDLVLT